MPPHSSHPVRRALALGAAFCVLAVQALAIPAFPGAEGAGGNAVGGRSGDVYHVTNTNPSGAGSLAYGLTTGVPAAGRTIVFDVSGYAHISVTLRVTASKITIAGQTAPGDGFGLKDGTFLVSGDDIIVRHLRFRDGNSADSIDLDSGSLNSIFDHCDVMLSNDENMSSFKSAPENMTYQWGLNAWGMESHSCGGLWDQNHATCHHTLWAHNHTRNPKGRTLLLDWVNNVTFDWDIGFILGDSTTPANWNTNVIGNYFIAGTSGKSKALEKGALDRNGAFNYHVWLSNNRFDGNVNGLVDGTDTGWGMVSDSTKVDHLAAALAINGGGTLLTQYATKDLWVQGVVSGSGPLSVDDIASLYGEGVVFFASANTYSGVLTVNASSAGFSGGRISVNHASALSSATINNLSDRAGGGGILFDAAVTSTAFGALSGSGAFALPTGALAVGGNNASTTFSGALSGAGGLTKSGTGVLTLTGANTYTGPTLVNAGWLLVAGSLANTPLTVASGAFLGGSGTIGGTVTASAGATLSPGTAAFTGATLTIGSGLALNGNTLFMDLSNSPAGANDRIAMSGGTLALSGSQYFQFLLLDGTLGAGNYNLITGATSTLGAPAFTHNLPVGTRQTFDLALVGAVVQLTVTGDPATLTWTGATSANWDTATANNWTGATPNTFGSNDAVVIDDSSAVTSIALPAPVSPRSTLVNNTTRAFNLAGGLNGGSLTKSGTNTLTLAGANTFAGGLTLNAGTIVLADDAANNGALGTGFVTMYGGVISMHDDMASYNAFNANLVVPAGATARLNADSRVDMFGTLSGAGTLNFFIPNIRTTLFTDWSAFTGIINVLTDASGGDFRMGTSYSFPGFPQAAVVLTDKVWAYYTGTLSSGAGTTIEIGELSGAALSVLEGGATGGRNFTYRIGGKNTDATFAGTIQEQNTGTTTSYVKTGTGTWTLAGTCNWNGGTTVEQGTLKITGSVTCGAATSVASAAALNLANGSLSTDAVNIASGATFSASGNATLTGDFNNDGTATITGGTFACTGDVVNNGTMRFNGGAQLTATGAFVNNGLLDLLTSPSSLPANFQNNGVVLLRELVKVAAASKTGANFTVTIYSFSGHTYQLTRADTLAGPWNPVGAVQNGAHVVNGDGLLTPTLLTFTDTGATGAQRYYRVSVGP